MAEFQSVFNLIPSGEYHSAIVTGYSFDFCFFEKVILGQLHRAGVTNCLALIDQAMLEDSLGSLSGSAKTKSRGYSLVGIPSAGAFHPKLILLTGPKDGLLFVGSGNPTASGFGGNLELWGAMSIAEASEAKADILKQAWRFLGGYRSFVGGRSSLRFNWIERHSPWLTKPSIELTASWISLNTTTRCMFLATGQTSILRQLKEAIGHDRISKTEVFAPFFDADLKAIQRLTHIFGTDDLTIFLQPGLTHFSATALGQFKIPPKVYNFNTAMGIADQSSYLHAKCIRLEAENRNFILIGSANASVAALGDMEFRGTNEEACLLLETSDGDFLEDLGIRSGELVPVVNFPDLVPDQVSSAKNSTRSIHLKGIDLNDGVMECSGAIRDGYLVSPSAKLKIFDGWGSVITELPFDCSAFKAAKPVRLKYPAMSDVHALYGQIFDAASDLAISNSQLVHEINDIYRGDPDPTNRKLEAALSKLEFGEADILDVIRIVGLNVLIDEPELVAAPSVKGTVGGTEAELEKYSQAGERLDYEAFVNDQREDAPAETLPFKKSLQIERIFEVLAMLLNRTKIACEDIQLEEEESDSTTASFNRPDPDKSKSEIHEESAAQIKSLKKRVSRFFRDYNKRLENAVAEGKPLRIADLTRFCVISHMAIGFAGIMVKEKSASAEETNRSLPLLPLFLNPFEHGCVTGFLFNCVGTFLRASIMGVAYDTDELDKERVCSLKETALFHTLFLLAIVSEEKWAGDQWPVERWQSWRWGILQNTLFTLSSEIIDLPKVAREFEKRRRFCPIGAGTEELIARIERCRRQTVSLENGTTEQRPEIGLRSYFPKYGFVTIKHVEPMPSGNNELKVKFSGPGFPFSEDHIDFVAGSTFVWPKAKITIFA